MAVVHDLLPRIVQSGLGVLDPAIGVLALASAVRAVAPPPQAVVSPFAWRTLMAGARGKVFPVFKEFEDFASGRGGAAFTVPVAKPAQMQMPVSATSAGPDSKRTCAVSLNGVTIPYLGLGI